jgi:hypothetical protein
MKDNLLREEMKGIRTFAEMVHNLRLSEINDTVLNALRTQAQRGNNALQAMEEDRDNAGRSLKEVIEHNCNLQREFNRVNASTGGSHSWARIAARSTAMGSMSPPSSSSHSSLDHSDGGEKRDEKIATGHGENSRNEGESNKESHSAGRSLQECGSQGHRKDRGSTQTALGRRDSYHGVQCRQARTEAKR